MPEVFARKNCVLYAYLLDDAVIKPHYAKHTVYIFDEQTPVIFITRRGKRECEILTEVDFEKNGCMGTSTSTRPPVPRRG